MMDAEENCAQAGQSAFGGFGNTQGRKFYVIQQDAWSRTLNAKN